VTYGDTVAHPSPPSDFLLNCPPSITFSGVTANPSCCYVSPTFNATCAGFLSDSSAVLISGSIDGTYSTLTAVGFHHWQVLATATFSSKCDCDCAGNHYDSPGHVDDATGATCATAPSYSDTITIDVVENMDGSYTISIPNIFTATGTGDGSTHINNTITSYVVCTNYSKNGYAVITP
jgi:hypothetical protein